jgi:hypothetical protein
VTAGKRRAYIVFEIGRLRKRDQIQDLNRHRLSTRT